MTENTVPPLPSGSVDLSALHAAEAAGKDIAEAIDSATTRVEPMTVAEFEELPSLSGKTKAELLKIAGAEDVVADDAMTNAAIVEAITAKRTAAPLVGDSGEIIPPATDGTGADITAPDDSGDADASA